MYRAIKFKRMKTIIFLLLATLTVSISAFAQKNTGYEVYALKFYGRVHKQKSKIKLMNKN